MERVKIGDAVLYHGDCLEILPTLPKVDAVVTDPPYGMNKDIANDGDWAVPVTKAAIDACRAITDGNILAFWSAQRPDVISDVFWPFKRVMVWNKTFALYAPHNVGYRFEYIVWVRGDTANKKRGDIFEGFPIAFRAQSENASHPTQKPLSVVTELITDFSTETILDPFMGSGTTGVACAQLGRKFIGIEIERRYFDIACERIEKAYAQGKLFEEPVTKPEQAVLL